MLCFHLKNNDPYFCLATEEYLLKNFKNDIFILWQSSDTVVVGKHQNLLGEINYPFCRKNKIKLARRISGGGTVYHDAGNVNFTYIRNVNSPAEVSFKMFTQPVVDVLAQLGIMAETSGRNDLLVKGKKISGNAEHIFKNRVLHHGTLLFNSDLKNLGQAIKVLPRKYQSKAVQSNRSEVANISSSLEKQISIEEFVNFLLNVQIKKPENVEYKLTENDTSQIQKLITEKFTNWDWIYGYSPAYSFKNKMNAGSKVLEVGLEVKKGIIQECQITGDYFPEKKSKLIEKELHYKKHDYPTIKEILDKIQIKVQNKIIDIFF